MENALVYGYGLCECGCGGKVSLAKQTARARGYVKGEPVRFIRNHQTKNKFREKSAGWNGGKYIDNRGYARILDPLNPRADSKGYVQGYIAKAGEALGKPVPDGAVVHHHNDELTICENQAYHLFLHVRTRAYLATGSPNKRKCKFCKAWDDMGKLYIKGNNHYHNECANNYNKNRLLKRKTGKGE